ncbi:MAG: tetratricopeptide repeat protein, partial [Flavobacteriales bacterium]|nr:tetratricopeptide repeat protein [Flavobacteriales bacterium]
MRIQHSLLLAVLPVMLAINCKPKTQDPPAETSQSTSSETVDANLKALNAAIVADPNNAGNYLARARYYGGKKDFSHALEDIGRALDVDSTRTDVHLYKGEVYWEMQEIKKSYDAYADCIRFDPQSQDCLLKKAAIDIVLNKYDVALEHINTVLRQDEQVPYAYYLKARLYKSAGDTTLAASSYMTALELDPEFYDAYVEVGLLYASQRSDIAIEYYNTALEIRPKSVEAWYNKAMYLQENAANKPERYEQAKECYAAIESIDPNNALANFNKGYIALEYQQQYETGVKEFS